MNTKIELGEGFQYSLESAVGRTLSTCRRTVTLDQGVSWMKMNLAEAFWK